MASNWSLRHPSRTVVRAVLKLTRAEQAADPTILTLRETSALLIHLRAALKDAFRFEAATRATPHCAICVAAASSQTPEKG